MRRSNELLRGQSSHARLTMRIETAKWQRSLELESWNQGATHSILCVHGPAKERGNGTLKIASEIWNWLPSVERVMKIPPSMMHSAWMGSDFTYEDMVKADAIVRDYTHRIVTTETSARGTRYEIESIPKPNAPVVWGKVTLLLLVDETGVLPIQESDYSERGELMRVISFSEPKKMGGRRIPTKLECRPQRRPDQKTTITYRDFAVDVKFPKDFFSLRVLQEPLR